MRATGRAFPPAPGQLDRGMSDTSDDFPADTARIMALAEAAIAGLAVELAQQGLNGALPRGGHVGFYLIDQGQMALIVRAKVRPSLRERWRHLGRTPPLLGYLGAVVLLAAGISLHLVVRGLLQVPVEGSIPLFMAGAALCLFATTAMGIFLATIARSMPQFGLLMVLILLPLQLLSGGMTPRESMPELVQSVMLLAPTTHFVELGQAILYRGAGLDVVWQPFLALAAIGSALFALSLARFRKTISQMA